MNPLDQLETLTGLTRHARGYAVQIFLQKQVATLLDTSFEKLKTADPYSVLQHLFEAGMVQMETVKQYIVSLKLDPQKVAEVLANHCFSSVLDAYTDTWSDLPSDAPKPAGTAMAVWSPKVGLRSRVTALHSPSRPSAAPVGLWSPSKSPARTGKAPETPGTPVATKEAVSKTSREFIDFVSIADRPEFVGSELLSLLQKYWQERSPLEELETKAATEASFRFEVEMLVHAHFCFLISSNLEGIETTLSLIRARVPRYVRHKQFKLLVRLLTGTKQYARLQYCLDLLIQYDCFEMILGKQVVVDEPGKKELQRALYQFLKTNYPSHDAQMKLVLIHFSMFREHAERLHEYAMRKLENLKGVSAKEMRSLLPRCLSAMDTFLDAAENFQKSNSHNLAVKCHEQAALLGLQIDNPDSLFLHLSKAEARQLMTFTAYFSQACVIANAYDLNVITEWIGPLYQQVIIEGNIDFFCDFAGEVPYNNQLFWDLIRKYKATDKHKKQEPANLKLLLGYVTDHFERYSMLKDLAQSAKEFREAAEGLLEIPGILYFRSDVNNSA